MRAWAANVAGHGRESFCEQCGASGVIRTERQVADRPRREELLPCPGCSLLTCPACWPGPFLVCRSCCVRQDPALVALVGEARPQRLVTQVGTGAGLGVQRRRARPSRTGMVAAAAIVAVALVSGAVALTRPGGNTGGVAGLTARTTPTAGAATPSADTGVTGSAAPPSSTTDPGAEPTSSSTASPRPGTPSDLRVTSSAVVPWLDPLGELRAQVLVGVTNRGGTPGYLPSAASAWQVLSPDGVVIARGRFAHVFPRLVQPGATTWLVDAVSATFAQPGELDSLRVTLDERAATAADDAELERLAVTDVEWRLDDAGSLSVSGVVENRGSQPVVRWSVGVVLVAADGAPLAAAYEVGSDASLAAGATARFSTSYPGSAPVATDDVAAVVAVAVPLD